MGTRHNHFFPYTNGSDNTRPNAAGATEGARHHHDHRPDFEAFRRGPGFGGRGGFGPGFPGFAAFGADFGRGPGRGGRGRARRGDIRLAILSLLAEAPSNGYGLMKTIAERTDNAWRPSPGSVYPTLSQLVDEEFIAATGEGRQQTFDLTETGRAYVSEHAAEIAAAWGEATVDADHRHDEFIGSAMKLAGVVKQFAFDATPEQRAAGKEKIDELRKALYNILAE
jgi:DNA-binding PadR family transcriptional regulator